MPDDLTKKQGRVIGRSRTHQGSQGKELVLTNPMDRAYLCQKLCACNAGTKIRNKLGHELKQRCTTASIWADEEINQLVWRYKAEVGYSMAATPPAPLMSRDQPNRPSRFPLGRAIGEGLLKRDLEGGMQKGLLRIPDCIVLKSTGIDLAAMRAAGHIEWSLLIPVRENIETVLEIKFASDRLTLRQLTDYRKIAGRDRFRLLEIADGDCGLKRHVPATAPVRIPVTTPMKREVDAERRWYQLLPEQPVSAPAPSPQLPQYGPVAAEGQHRALSTILKENPVKSGVLLVGAILLTIVAARALIVAAAVGLVATAATAAPNSKKKERNDHER
jgi:hypothetical protein